MEDVNSFVSPFFFISVSYDTENETNAIRRALSSLLGTDAFKIVAFGLDPDDEDVFSLRITAWRYFP